MWRQDWHKCRTRKGCVTLGTGMYARVWVKIWTCTVQCFLKRGSKEFWLASSFEGHGSSLRSLPHPSLYPRTPLIWFEQHNLFFNLRLAMIWHVFLFNFLQWLQNIQEAPCLCHSRPGWYETIRDRKSEFRSQLWKFWGQSGKTNMAFICPKMAKSAYIKACVKRNLNNTMQNLTLVQAFWYTW